ncbi:MAG: threonylcarbamoyl-AMP synthase [candidate division Zixibacteria bacterium]|nr:threonylcarbamoyl-AMP synthase [candidate division Zixibacteria bacterium]
MKKTNIRRINPLVPEPEILKEALQVLRNNGIIMAPTETKYGLLARIDSEETVKKVYDIKSRSLSKPTAIFVRSNDEMNKFAEINHTANTIAKKFLPGPLTLILKAQTELSAPIVIDNKIGLRFSSSALISKLLSQTDFNLTATSANISGKEEPGDIDEAISQFGDNIDLYLDAGPLNGSASTVVDCSGETYKILREGAIVKEDIRNSLEIN